MKVALENCSLEISHIGTKEEIDMQIFMEQFSEMARELADAITQAFADTFECIARTCCQISKNLRSSIVPGVEPAGPPTPIAYLDKIPEGWMNIEKYPGEVAAVVKGGLIRKVR